MRRSDHLLKTMSAIRWCVDECRNGPNPARTLEKCVKELRLNRDWNDAEVAEVEAGVRRALGSACDSGAVTIGCQPTTGVETHV